MQFSADEHQFYIKGAPVAIRKYMVNYMGAAYSESKDTCRLPRTLQSLKELCVKMPEFLQMPEVTREGYKLTKEVKQRAEVQIAEPPEIPGDRLRKYQRQDVEFLKKLDAAGIFNEPRTGKTPTTLVMLKEKGTRRNLIVCPASLIWTWEREAREWYPEAHTFVIGGKIKGETTAEAFNEAARHHPAILIVSKNRVDRIQAFNKITFDTLVVDEAHYLRNYKTAQSKAVYKIKRKQVFPLTGTPTVNHPIDIYGLLHLMFPKAFTSYWGLAARYFKQAYNPHSVTGMDVGDVREDRAEELQQLVALNSVSRKRKDVMPWLPEKIRKTIYAKMGPSQQKAYDEMRDTFNTILDSGEEVDAATILAQLTRLRQLSIDPRMLGAKARGCKTDLLVEWLGEREDKSRPVVVMSMFTSYLNLLNKELECEGYRIGMITGEMTGAQKQKAADDFQAGKLDILLCNIISAGTGWTLDRGDTVIFVDNAWNPVDMQQAEDRVTPTSEDRNHDHKVIHIATVDSVDERMFRILARKKDITDLLNTSARESLKELLQ